MALAFANMMGVGTPVTHWVILTAITVESGHTILWDFISTFFPMLTSYNNIFLALLIALPGWGQHF